MIAIPQMSLWRFQKKRHDAVTHIFAAPCNGDKGTISQAAWLGKESLSRTNFLRAVPGGVTLERLCREKPVETWVNVHLAIIGQNWIGLKHEADHAIRYCRGEQLLSGSPKRIDVHRAVQPEQRLFQCRIDYRLALADSNAVSLHVLLSRARAPKIAVSQLVALLKKTTLVPEAFNNRPDKKAT